MPGGGVGGGAGGGGGSHSSGAAGAQLDIIDLDRYMRGAVRPLPRRDLPRDRLVVDGGGGGGGGVGGAGGPGSKASSSSSERPRESRDKRYSHDSGLSDGSYLRSRHARHSRSAHHPKRSEAGGGRSRRETRGEGEASDLRSFRAACERALRDQQEQIARVAALCERLTAAHPRRPRDSSSELSELSSTSRSRSERDARRRDPRDSRDTHRVANEYKTYKIIMSKLDDLNRRLAARAAGAGGAGGRARSGGARGARRGSHSAASSERSGHHSRHTAHAPGRATCASSRLVERAVGDADEGGAVVAGPELRSPSGLVASCAPVARPQPPRAGSPEARSQLARLSPRRAHELDIPPREAQPPATASRPPAPRLNVATESVVERCSSSSGESAHVYAQKKRVKAPSRRSRSEDVARGGRGSKRSALHSPAGSERAAGAGGPGGPGGLGGLGALAAGFWRAPSLCYLCRSYWRALRHCIRHQFAPAL